jgi:hypothetical protein
MMPANAVPITQLPDGYPPAGAVAASGDSELESAA